MLARIDNSLFFRGGQFTLLRTSDALVFSFSKGMHIVELLNFSPDSMGKGSRKNRRLSLSRIGYYQQHIRLIESVVSD